MAWHSRPKDGVASARLCPGHPRLSCRCGHRTWMPGTSPGMTSFAPLPDFSFTIGEPFAVRVDEYPRCRMSQAQHYKFQADQAKRLARQVSDAEGRDRLLEMAGEYS